jgi:hypothetical protein
MTMMVNDSSNNYSMTITTEERLKINVKYLAWLYAKSKERNKQNNDVFDTERVFELAIRDAGGEKPVKELFLKEQDDKIIDELVSLDPTIAETLGQL